MSVLSQSSYLQHHEVGFERMLRPTITGTFFEGYFLQTKRQTKLECHFAMR